MSMNQKEAFIFRLQKSSMQIMDFIWSSLKFSWVPGLWMLQIPVDWKEKSSVVGFVICLVKIRELQAVLPGVEKAENRMVSRENLGPRKGSEASSQVCVTTGTSQVAAVGALIHMLRNTRPLRQDSSCYTTIKAVVEGETGSASKFYVPRKASDALEELKAYTQLKDMLLPKSTTHSGTEGGNLA